MNKFWVIGKEVVYGWFEKECNEKLIELDGIYMNEYRKNLFLPPKEVVFKERILTGKHQSLISQ